MARIFPVFRMQRLKWIRLPVIVTALIAQAPAAACTLCHTDIASEIRAGILGPDFWQNVGISILPFALVLTIALHIFNGGQRK
jgi:hypothetical protein